jgi:hypothetical protein
MRFKARLICTPTTAQTDIPVDLRTALLSLRFCRGSLLISSWPHPGSIPDLMSQGNQPGLGSYNKSQARPYSRQPPPVGLSDHAISAGFWNRETHSPNLDLFDVSLSPFNRSLGMSRSLSTSSGAQLSTPLCFDNESSFQRERGGHMAMQQELHPLSNMNISPISFMGFEKDPAPKLAGSEQVLGGRAWPSHPRLIEPEYVIGNQSSTGHGTSF